MLVDAGVYTSLAIWPAVSHKAGENFSPALMFHSRI
jgi:hypothetical protein